MITDFLTVMGILILLFFVSCLIIELHHRLKEQKEQQK